MDYFYDYFDRYSHPPLPDPELVARRRAWLGEHLHWSFNRWNYLIYLHDSHELDYQALADFPGPIWLSVNDGQITPATLEGIARLPELAGLELSIGKTIGNKEFARFAKAAQGLKYLALSPLGRATVCLSYSLIPKCGYIIAPPGVYSAHGARRGKKRDVPSPAVATSLRRNCSTSCGSVDSPDFR